MSSTFKISSPAFANEQKIPEPYTCEGQDIHPPLEINGVPENAQTLAIIMEDPDSPMPPVFDHWLIWNIPVDTTELPEGSLPAGCAQGKNSLKNAQYNGPCTSNGTHRYFFNLYALDCKLDLAEGSNKDELKKAMEGHILVETNCIGLYSANLNTQTKLAVEMAKTLVK